MYAHLNAGIRWVLVSTEKEQGCEVVRLHDGESIVIVSSNLAMAIAIAAQADILNNALHLSECFSASQRQDQSRTSLDLGSLGQVGQGIVLAARRRVRIRHRETLEWQFPRSESECRSTRSHSERSRCRCPVRSISRSIWSGVNADLLTFRA